ncbi:MAG: hypothetical protein Q8Q10_00065, partial [bacterium]|nr:hypothetical protein [bacterium]
MLPLYPAERPRMLRKKHLYYSIPAAIFLMSGLYFFTPFFGKNQEIALAPQPEGVALPLTDWVDENPVFEEVPTQEVANGKETDKEKESAFLPPPLPPQVERMKKQGCVADGFLSGYGGDINSSIALINRSKCYYLHRALETWLRPPDFKLAQKIQRKVTKPNTVYGMFIAEAIDTKANYYYPAEERDFNFDDMCRPGSKNFWGEHTCKPSLERAEYRQYVQYIAEQAMDMGIQSFLFGQVFYQDAGDLRESIMPEVIRYMREYADFRGMKILIGAQTNDITDEKYLRLFDY